MRRAILFAFVFLILQAGAASALYVQSGQEAIKISAEAGSQSTFFLVIRDIAGETITASSWTAIEGNRSYRLPSGGIVILNTSISIPAGQGIGTYTETIKHDGSYTLTTIQVTVTIPTTEIEKLRALADVAGKISSLESSLTSKIDSKLNSNLNNIQSKLTIFSSDLSSSIKEVKSYSRQINDMEREKTSLENEIQGLSTTVATLKNQTQHLEEKNDELETTGNILRTESPVLFFLGLLVGSFGIFLFYRRLHKYL